MLIFSVFSVENVRPKPEAPQPLCPFRDAASSSIHDGARKFAPSGLGDPPERAKGEGVAV